MEQTTEQTQTADKSTAFELPQGWFMAADGRPMSLDNVDPHKKATHKLVKSLSKKAQGIRGVMVKFRQECDQEIDLHLEAMFEEHGKKLGGKKGGLTLQSLDGLSKVTRSVSGTLKFDERILVARDLVMEFIKGQSGTKELKTIAYSAFETNNDGDYSPAKLSALTKNKFDDENWSKACTLIDESRYYDGQKPYLRFYERETFNDEWKVVSLDLAQV